MKTVPSSGDKLDETEVAARRDDALLRALSTPHKTQAEMKVGAKSRRLKVRKDASSAFGPLATGPIPVRLTCGLVP